MRRTSFLFVALFGFGSLGAMSAQADPSGGPVTSVEPPPKVQVERHVRIESGQTFVNSGYTVSFGCCGNCGGGVGGSFGASAYTMPTETYTGVTITVGG